jgi:hypothetical protein
MGMWRQKSGYTFAKAGMYAAEVIVSTREKSPLVRHFRLYSINYFSAYCLQPHHAAALCYHDLGYSHASLAYLFPTAVPVRERFSLTKLLALPFSQDVVYYHS